jgi:undecaprenyl-diphosphatase
MDALVIFAATYLILAPVIMALALPLTLPRERRVRFLILCMIALPLAYLIAKTGSLLFYHDRPFVVLGIEPLIPHAPDNGFPSDHTLLAATLACAMYAFDTRWGRVAIAIAAVIGAARVIAHVHHAIDILGSFVIALLAVFLVARLVEKYAQHKDS